MFLSWAMCFLRSSLLKEQYSLTFHFQAVEDGVDILSLSIGPSAVPTGPAAFLNILEMELLFAVKAGVLVVQAVGNGGPTPSSVLSFSPWITSVAASTIDRKYNNSIVFGNGQVFTGTALSCKPLDLHRHIYCHFRNVYLLFILP